MGKEPDWSSLVRFVDATPRRPDVIARGAGAHIWDADGNRYIDYVLGAGAISIGHVDPEITAFVERQARDGVFFGGGHESECQLAFRLTELIPCCELVSFYVGGSAATTAAVRVARAYTNRDRVIFTGYHGWHDWASPDMPGVPKQVAALSICVSHNDTEALERAFKVNGSKVACLIMEPAKSSLVETGYLEMAAALARKNGALLIFDEVKTGFRFSLGGAQQYFGVTPDIAVFSKALSNGYPIAALVGRRKYLEIAKEWGICRATFQTHLPSIAAALATINALETRRGIEHIWSLGERLQVGLNSVFSETGFPMHIGGYAPMLFAYQPKGADELVEAFAEALSERGVSFEPRGILYICVSHSESDIDHTIDAAYDSICALKRR